MADESEASEAINWNNIWVTAQELGAALRPLIESGDAPEWAVELSNALVDADEPLTELALEAIAAAEEPGDE